MPRQFRSLMLQAVGAAAALLSLVAVETGAKAQSAPYPTRPVRIVLPYAAGGATDVIARVVADALGTELGQSVIVENRTGAGVVAGTEQVARAQPDGYTLLFTTLAHSINVTLHQRLPYDSVNDFEFVAHVGALNFALIVRPDESARDFNAFLAGLRERPGQQYASAGVGSPMHLGIELMRRLSSTEVEHIPYRGESAAITDLLGNRVSFMLCSVLTCASRIRDGSIRALAVTTATRSELIPQVPSASEVGMPDFQVYSWFVILAPKGTPRPVVDRLSTAVNTILARPDLRARISAMGVQLETSSTPESTAALVRREIERWAPVVRATGATAN